MQDKELSKDGIIAPNMLAKQAKRELKQTGRTSITCQKCGGSPELFKVTGGGERNICSCPCGYIHDVEIVF